MAAHITAASEGGPRYDPALSQEARIAIENGIWLCHNCAKLADNDPARFTVAVLYIWKTQAESDALSRVGKAVRPPRGQAQSAEAQIRRNLELRDRMRRDFFKTPEELRALQPPFKPRRKLAYGEAIIRAVTDKAYPEMDESPGISSWFKVELYDFYHNG